MAKQQKYSNEYIKFGFTLINENCMTKPQCVLCNAVLSVEAMKPSKLKRHLNTQCPEHVEKNLSFCEHKELTLKQQKLDSKAKPNSIGEKLVKPCAVTMVNLVSGESAAKKIEQVFLSDDTVRRRISHISLGVKQQVIEEVKAPPLFTFQDEESTDMALCSQLVVFVRYIHEHDTKTKFLFCTPLKTIKSEDVMEKIFTFFDAEDLQWNKLCRICTDAAPATLGSRLDSRLK